MSDPRAARLAGALAAAGLRARVEMRPDPTGFGAFAFVHLDLDAMREAEREGAAGVVQALAAFLGLPVVLLDADRPQTHRAPRGVDEARAILGLAHDFTARDVTLAWRRLARAAHPDAGGSSEALLRVRYAVKLAREHLAAQAECAA